MQLVIEPDDRELFRVAAAASLVPPGTTPAGRPTRVAALEQRYLSTVLATLIAERQRRAIVAEVARLLLRRAER
jgi:hypothetical protein